VTGGFRIIMTDEVARQADTEALEDQAAEALGLKLNLGNRFGEDAQSQLGESVEIKSVSLDSRSAAVQFAHNRYPDKYDKFLEQQCVVVFHRKSIAEEYWLLKRGEGGFWTQWVTDKKLKHGREDEILKRMMSWYKNTYSPLTAFDMRIVDRTIPGAVLTKKQWSFPISYVRQYGEKLTTGWPTAKEMARPPIQCDPKDHPRMFGF